MNNKFFDEEAVEKVRERQKEAAEINKQKAKFTKVNANTNNLEGSSGRNYANEALLKAYIGPNFETMMNRGFSFWPLLFGPLHYLYWKMYTKGIMLTFFESLLASTFLLYGSSISYAPIIYLVIFLIERLILCSTFKESYLNFAVNNIIRIKKEHITEDTEEICRRAGGPSIIKAILVGFVFSFILTFVLTIVGRFLK